MEGPEEFMGSTDHTLVVKGKRTKRQRPLSPFGAVMTSSSSSGGGGGGGRGDYCSISSPTTSSGEVMESTEEEEDMANCLILLAQGFGPRRIEDSGAGQKFSSSSFTEMAATTVGKAGFYVYECKTCNRTFPSFQALGGHRASHKKPKAVIEEKKALPAAAATAVWDDDYYEDGQFSKIRISPPLSLQIGNNKALQISSKSKVHECSICGSEFSSGQALGGHMRRHRSNATSRIAMSMETSKMDLHDDRHKKEAAVAVAARNILPLDLNLPAPEDELHPRDSKFQFASSQQQQLVFSAPALVDCHY